MDDIVDERVSLLKGSQQCSQNVTAATTAFVEPAQDWASQHSTTAGRGCYRALGL